MYRVLIVDKDDATYHQLRSIDWKALHVTQIERCSSFREAVSIGPKYSPHIVISSVKLVDGWGYDLIYQYLLSDIRSCFIMVSKYDNYDYVRKCLLLGAKDYIIKPFHTAHIENLIKKMVTQEFSHGVEQILQTKLEKDPITGRLYGSYSSLTIKTLHILKNEYNKNISLKSIADKLVMNSKYIGQQFVNDTGLHFTDYRFAFRMLLAKQLIISTDYKIQDISNEIGFTYPNHFFTAFKVFFGVSPNDIRRQNYLYKCEDMELTRSMGF